MKLNWIKTKNNKENMIENHSFRNKIWFAFWPVCIEKNDRKEQRWWCYVRVKQEYLEFYRSNDHDYNNFQVGHWENIEFLEI